MFSQKYCFPQLSLPICRCIGRCNARIQHVSYIWIVDSRGAGLEKRNWIRYYIDESDYWLSSNAVVWYDAVVKSCCSYHISSRDYSCVHQVSPQNICHVLSMSWCCVTSLWLTLSHEVNTIGIQIYIWGYCAHGGYVCNVISPFRTRPLITRGQFNDIDNVITVGALSMITREHHHHHHHQVPSSCRRLAAITLHCSRSWASLTSRIPVHSVIFVIHSVLGLPLITFSSSGPSNNSLWMLLRLIMWPK